MKRFYIGLVTGGGDAALGLWMPQARLRAFSPS